MNTYFLKVSQSQMIHSTHEIWRNCRYPQSSTLYPSHWEYDSLSKPDLREYSVITYCLLVALVFIHSWSFSPTHRFSIQLFIDNVLVFQLNLIVFKIHAELLKGII